MIGGRYGLSSKEFTPAMAKAVLDELDRAEPRNHFAFGVEDEVGGTSLDWDRDWVIEAADTHRAVFYGLGADGRYVLVTNAKGNDLSFFSTEGLKEVRRVAFEARSKGDEGRLFRDRAAEVRPDFELTDENDIKALIGFDTLESDRVGDAGAGDVLIAVDEVRAAVDDRAAVLQHLPFRTQGPVNGKIIR